ncbi:hypothetical protein [Lysinibacillus sp. C5.1]|uniref:hypothetical protein n=1 Tax=Lysinibacillus sp. C5.1 TaxID=2796169 RepID=UPI00308169DD
MAFQYKVRNPDGTMGEMKKFGDEDTAEEKAARLEQENQLLVSSMREMSTYIANQEQRLAEQERAIIELSSLIAKESEGGEQKIFNEQSGLVAIWYNYVLARPHKRNQVPNLSNLRQVVYHKLEQENDSKIYGFQSKE